MGDAITRKEFEQQLIKLAWENDEFNKELIENPRAAVEKMLGFKMPDGVDFEILVETDQRKYIVLPMRMEDGELTDDMLDYVAGGEYDIGVCGYLFWKS